MTIQAAGEAAVHNEYASNLVAKAETAIGTIAWEPSELALRKTEGELRSEISSLTHRLEFILKHRELLVKEHSRILRKIERRSEEPSCLDKLPEGSLP